MRLRDNRTHTRLSSQVEIYFEFAIEVGDGHHHFDGDVQEVASAGFTERLRFNQSFKQQCSRGFTTKRPLSTKTYVSLFGENVLVNV